MTDPSSGVTKSDRIKGMFVAFAVGDALGAPHELRRGAPLSQYTGEPHLPIVMFNRYTKTTRRSAIGQCTDDTEMMLALYSTIRDGKYDRTRALEAYLAWANSGCPFLGKNTRMLFHGLKTIKGYEARFAKRDDLSSAQSNGALMRCAPLALLPDSDTAVFIDCCLTNPNATSIDSCIVYVYALKLLLSGVEDSLLQRLSGITTSVHTQVSAVIADAMVFDLEKPRDVTGQTKGWCLHALWCSLVAIAHFNDPWRALDYVVRLGGDTDTNAAIAGALLGARFGYQRLHDGRPTAVETVLSCDTSQGDVERPRQYTLAVINTL